MAEQGLGVEGPWHPNILTCGQSINPWRWNLLGWPGENAWESLASVTEGLCPQACEFQAERMLLSLSGYQEIKKWGPGFLGERNGERFEGVTQVVKKDAWGHSGASGPNDTRSMESLTALA